MNNKTAIALAQVELSQLLADELLPWPICESWREFPRRLVEYLFYRIPFLSPRPSKYDIMNRWESNWLLRHPELAPDLELTMEIACSRPSAFTNNPLAVEIAQEFRRHQAHNSFEVISFFICVIICLLFVFLPRIAFYYAVSPLVLWVVLLLVRSYCNNLPLLAARLGFFAILAVGLKSYSLNMELSAPFSRESNAHENGTKTPHDENNTPTQHDDEITVKIGINEHQSELFSVICILIGSVGVVYLLPRCSESQPKHGHNTNLRTKQDH